MNKDNSFKPLDIARKVISTEIESLEKMRNGLSSSFELAVQLIHQATTSHSKVILTGMGKSGIIAQKIAASLSSTGTPSIFLHSAEAVHGDLGRIQSNDVILALSHSGESSEILQLIPFVKENNNPLIAICGNKDATLSRLADCFLESAITKEACQFNLTPTSSTTSMLALGDALTIALMEKNQFSPTDFARFHPKGSLGKRLLTSVNDVMQTNIPEVQETASLIEVINQMSEGRLGCVLIRNQKNGIDGIITDGDLRRCLEKHQTDSFDLKAVDIATKNPITIAKETKLEQAKNLMNEKQITCLVVKENNQVIGIVQIFSCEI